MCAKDYASDYRLYTTDYNNSPDNGHRVHTAPGAERETARHSAASQEGGRGVAAVCHSVALRLPSVTPPPHTWPPEARAAHAHDFELRKLSTIDYKNYDIFLVRC